MSVVVNNNDKQIKIIAFNPFVTCFTWILLLFFYVLSVLLNVPDLPVYRCYSQLLQQLRAESNKQIYNLQIEMYP